MVTRSRLSVALLAALAILSAVVVVGCEGEDDDVLHLRFGDITEDNFRIYVATLRLVVLPPIPNLPSPEEANCNALRERGLEGFVNWLNGNRLGHYDFDGLGTADIGQPGKLKSEERAYEIAQEVFCTGLPPQTP